MAHLLDRCGTLPPTDRDVHAAGGAFRHADARGLFTAGRSAYYNNGVSARSMRHLPPTDRDFHAAGGAFRHADARGLFTAGRSAYYNNGVSARSMRHLPPTDRDFHAAGGAFRHADARGGFRPANAARTPPHFSPHATYRRLISSYKFLLSPPLFPVAAPIALRSARSAIVQRAPGRFAPHSFPLHGGETPTGLFFHLQVLPVLAAPPAPLQASSPWRCPVRRSAAVPPRPPPRSPRNPDCAAVCPHPFTPFIPPIARAPRL